MAGSLRRCSPSTRTGDSCSRTETTATKRSSRGGSPQAWVLIWFDDPDERDQFRA